MSFITGTNTELIYASTSSGTAKASFTTEVQINDTAGMDVQSHLPPDFWLPSQRSEGQGIRIVARGILSSTGTPTYTFTIRLGAAGSITAAIVLGTAALTTGSGVTNQIWQMEGDFVVTNIGATGANSSGQGVGLIWGSGFATTINPAYGGGTTPGTVATLDTSITNYVNFNVACSASSASNSVTLQQLLVFGLN
jgi:hypothetical protein